MKRDVSCSFVARVFLSAAAIEFEAVWDSRDPSVAHLAAFAEHLRETVPALVRRLAV